MMLSERGLQLLAGLWLASTATAADFDWKSITPSRDLQYHDCYDTYKCAKLQVPLDWKNDSDPRLSTIAIRKLPAVVAEDDDAFAGTILTNPGGPGESGILTLPGRGPALQLIVDRPGRQHYEILSWDPRGVGESEPKSDCFPSNIPARNAYISLVKGNDGFTRNLNRGLAIVKAWSESCRNAGDAMRFVNTPSNARDMVAMVDKIDERHTHLVLSKAGEKYMQRQQAQASLDLRNDVGEPRLKYIGYSYGTILGNTFASMFPGRVGRMVLDGVADAWDYSNGPGWLTALEDNEKVYEQFIQGCFSAGPSVCALARADDMTPAQISVRLKSWIRGLDDTPLSVLTDSGAMSIISSNDVRKAIGDRFYKPISTFKLMAETLDQAMRGNTTSLVDQIVSSTVPDMANTCPSKDGVTQAPAREEAAQAVICGDGGDVTNKSVEWWRGVVDSQTSLSEWYGPFILTARVGCASWPFKPNWSFKGPFKTPKADASGVVGHPTSPLLFLSNTLDNVTPLDSARRMAAGHPGSGLVIQNSIGHSTTITAPSSCTRNIVADYIEHGVVPANETVCETLCGPWDDGCTIFKGLAI